MMKCRHCGKEYEDSFSYCPYCAEPKPVEDKEIPTPEVVSHRDKNIWVDSLGLSIFVYLPCCLIVWISSFFLLMFTWDDDSPFAILISKIVDGGSTLWMVSALLAVLIGVINIISWKIKSPREKVISVQFEKDQTSICPKCGSHNIALGRKGYDWKKGFWYRIFNIKGGSYLAGEDSRRVTAHCQNCGHSWVTDEEWLK